VNELGCVVRTWTSNNGCISAGKPSACLLCTGGMFQQNSLLLLSGRTETENLCCINCAEFTSGEKVEDCDFALCIHQSSLV